MDSSIYSKRNVKKSVRYFVIGRLLSGMSGILTIILLAKYMSIESYATFIALSSLIMLLVVFSSLGLDKAVARYLPQSVQDRNVHEMAKIITLLGLIQLLIGLFSSIIVFVFWDYWVEYFEYINLQALPSAFFIFFISTVLFQYFSKVFQTLMLQKVLAQLLVIQWLGRLLLIFFLLYQADTIDIEDAFLVMAIPEATGVIFFILILFRHFIKHNKNTEPMQGDTDWNGVYHVAKNNYGFNLLAIPAQGYFMRLLISVFFSAEASAAYGFLSLIFERIAQYIPVRFFNAMIEPLLVSSYIKNKDFNYLRLVSQLFYKLSLIFLALCTLFIGIAGEVFIERFIKTEYAEYYWFIYIILFQLVFGSHMNSLQIILNSVNQSKLLVLSSSISVIVFTALCYVFILNNQYFLLFISIVFSGVNNYVIINLLNRRGFNYYIEVKFLITIFMVMFLELLFAHLLVLYIPFENQILYTLIIVILGVLLFFVLLKKFDFFMKSEVLMIKEYISRN